MIFLIPCPLLPLTFYTDQLKISLTSSFYIYLVQVYTYTYILMISYYFINKMSWTCGACNTSHPSQYYYHMN